MKLDISKHLENCLQWKIENGELLFSRFVEQQRPAYQLNAMYRNGYEASTGIRLRFLTDADTVTVCGSVEEEKFGIIGFFVQKVTHYQLNRRAKIRIPPKSLNTRGEDIASKQAFELLVDGVSLGQKLLENGNAAFSFENGDHKKKEVCLYFPQHAKAVLSSVEVNGEVWPAEKKDRTILTFGDSITSGSLGQKVSGSYVMTLAEKLDMNVINQGVPGYTFQPDSLNGLEHCPIEPDLITVAYGTNDWGFCSTKQDVDSNIKAYFQRLDAIFPTVRKFVITPLWRVDEGDETYYGSLRSIRETIWREAGHMRNTVVVDGEKMLPREIRYFQDGYVHPGSEGQKLYGENLYAAISSNL